MLRAIDDTYARFLLEEIIPAVGKDYNLVDDASGRAICGMSDGGLCSFTVVWERPDAFSKAISHIGSFRIMGAGPIILGSFEKHVEAPSLYVSSCRMERMT